MAAETGPRGGGGGQETSSSPTVGVQVLEMSARLITMFKVGDDEEEEEGV